MRRDRRDPRSASPIASVRPLWTAAAVAVAVLTVLIGVVAPRHATDIPPGLTVGLVLAIVVAAAVGAAAIERMLAATRPADDAAALAQYRTSSLLTLAVVLVPVPITIAAAFVLGPGWIAWVGGTGSLAVLAATRPGHRRVRRLDAAWQAAGHDISIEREATR